MSIIIHHNDLDGRCAAAIALHASPGATCIETDYGRPFPFESIPLDSVVVVVDFSLESSEDWIRLFSVSDMMVWLDHHKSALEKWQSFLSKEFGRVYGVRNTEKCGAKLAWDYFIRVYLDDAPPYPEALEYVDAWDRWTHGGNETVLNFAAGMELEYHQPDSMIWDKLLFGDAPQVLQRVVDNGNVINSYLNLKDHEELNSNSRVISWEGHEVLIINSARRATQLLRAELEKDDPSSFRASFYQRNDGRWHVELRGDGSVDLGQIAVRNGGGGHQGAAGFVCKSLPWD